MCHEGRRQKYLGEGDTLREERNFISKQHLLLSEDHKHPHKYKTSEDRGEMPLEDLILK